ncbi:MAG: rhamnulokinase [Clostridia bacterium]|nr:rhamnulokinase [Clostridia bacterium]
MDQKKYYLGFDFGASSGRAILGILETDPQDGKKKLALEEVYRFANEAVRTGDVLAWEMERLFGEMKTAIGMIAERGIHIESIGIDTWGVDFGIVGPDGNVVFRPVSYRDDRTIGMMEEAFKIMPKTEIFKHTGLAFLQFNTLYQLIAMKKNPETAKYITEENTLLFMPDLFAWYLTGKCGTEYTIASTSQMIDPSVRTWSKEILSAFGIPEGLFAPIQQPGEIRGYLKKEICPAIDYDVPVVAVASHDTASAVAAVPARKGESFAYLSSGTWSLLGVETPTPVCTEGVMNANFSNEGGLNGTTRLLKNIMGLWIIQECRKQFNKEREKEGLEKLSFADIVKEVEKAEKTTDAVIDVDDNAFFAPDGMADRVEAYVKKIYGTEIDKRDRVGLIADIVYRGLAVKYRWGIKTLEEINGFNIDALYIVGGGGKNELLNEYTASALKRPVRIGASEGTVIGNLLVQAMATKDVEDIWELRRIVADSFGSKTYDFDPAGNEKWDQAYEKLEKLIGE